MQGQALGVGRHRPGQQAVVGKCGRGPQPGVCPTAHPCHPDAPGPWLCADVSQRPVVGLRQRPADPFWTVGVCAPASSPGKTTQAPLAAVAWPALCPVGQKAREKPGVSVSHRIVYGSLEAVEAVLKDCGVGQVINTAFIERLNLTIRQHVAALARKVIQLAKTETGLGNQLMLSQGYYNFCLLHSALRLPLPEPKPTKGNGSAKKWQQRTPAVAANLTNRLWKLEELLLFRAPPWQQVLEVTS